MVSIATGLNLWLWWWW